MNTMLVRSIGSIMVMLMNLVPLTELCMCSPQHPQTEFCEADFVILARIKRSYQLYEKRVFKVRIRKEFKMSEKSRVSLKSGRIFTAFDDSMCGTNLETGKLYVLSGRIHSLSAQITMCNLNMKWDSLTKRQRRGFHSLYQKGCSKCTIRKCSNKKCNLTMTKQRDICKWTSPCHQTQGICVSNRNNRCKWSRNKFLGKCLNDEDGYSGMPFLLP